MEETEADTVSENENLTAGRNPALRSLLAGAGAGVVCTILCAPLDVTKIRMQVQGSLGSKRYSAGVFASVKRIYIEEGLRGVFKGIGPALVTVPLFWGVYWPIYDRSKAYFESNPAFSVTGGHIMAAVTAGAIGDVITNPFWVVRTRIQTLALHSECRIAANVSTVEMMKIIYQNEGWKAFYKGLGASFLGLSHVAIQFPLYEYLKNVARRGEDRRETFFELLFSSIAAKLVASSITYPHEVLRARLQDGRGVTYSKKTPTTVPNIPVSGLESMKASSGHANTVAVTKTVEPARLGLVSVLKDIIKREGVLSLWSGLRVSIFRVVPATASTFLAYEYISHYLHERTNL